ENEPFADQRGIVFQNALRAGYIGFLALDFDETIQQAGAHAQSTLDQADIFIAGAKKAFNTLVDLNACFHLWSVGYLYAEEHQSAQTSIEAAKAGEKHIWLYYSMAVCGTCFSLFVTGPQT